MNIIEKHELTVERNIIGMGWDGDCSCSDPDWTDRGWEGQVVFHGDTREEVQSQFEEHVWQVSSVD